MSKAKVTFKTWLLQQVDRDDPVGDLARDVRDDSTAGVVSMTRLETGYRLSTGAKRALQMARQEYIDMRARLGRAA